jgi:hypothetical protein
VVFFRGFPEFFHADVGILLRTKPRRLACTFRFQFIVHWSFWHSSELQNASINKPKMKGIIRKSSNVQSMATFFFLVLTPWSKKLFVHFPCPTCFEPLIWVNLQGFII